MTDKFNENLKKARQAGSGGRTRTMSACIRTYSGSVPNYVPKPIKKERSISPAPVKNMCMQ